MDASLTAVVLRVSRRQCNKAAGSEGSPTPVPVKPHTPAPTKPHASAPTKPHAPAPTKPHTPATVRHGALVRGGCYLKQG